MTIDRFFNVLNMPERKFARKYITDSRTFLQSSLWKISINKNVGDHELFRQAIAKAHRQALVNIQVCWELYFRHLLGVSFWNSLILFGNYA